MTDQDAIDRDVWTPFRDAYARCDVDEFATILAPEFVRVERSAGWIGDRAQYLERTADGFATATRRGDTLAIEFRFAERVVNDDLAYDRGSYGVTITDGSGASQRFFGRFFTIHRRTSVGWRMVLDQDEAADGHDAE